ncbi:hypothetical protein ACFSHT_35145 [Paraburkholderia silviterrae]|uniref:hypothetical protein n=1 Tax=Paraburkholderia silviterrae TaxID=2528715 RepID=UPI0014043175|nr:hypothetical protein [Paraburkholderia silviterrae]
MPKQITKEQSTALSSLLNEVMGVLRDDKPFNPKQFAFGELKSTENSPDDPGISYEYRNSKLPDSQTTITTYSDPLNDVEDRTLVPVVPVKFEIDFYDLTGELSKGSLERELDLANYWVGIDGKENKRNCYPSPAPARGILICRYRANPHESGRVPVDVDMFFSYRDNMNADMLRLSSIYIRRDYPYVTPAMRKQKREEKEQRIRELYGKPEAAK